MALVEVSQVGLDPWPERPVRLQPLRIDADRLDPTLATGHGVLPGLDHRRLDRRQLDHLTPTHPPATRLGQRLATSLTRARPTRHHHVRLAAHPADPDVTALRSGLPTPSRGPIRLLAPRRWHRRVVGRLHRPAELRQ